MEILYLLDIPAIMVMIYNMKKHIFSYYHSAVILLYFASAIIFSMCTLNPIFVLLSFLCSAVYLCYLKGFKQYIKSLWIYLIILLIVGLSNIIFNSLGLTVLFYIGDKPITFESLIYGICSGGMLINVLQWFSCYSIIMTSDKFLSLFGGIIPTIAMMLSMVFRYIPDTIRKANQINTAQNALLGNEKQDKKTRFNQGITLASSLMEWSMENSIETADSMRARGYLSGKRSHYKNERFTLYDMVSFIILLCLIIINALVIFIIANKFVFYPVISYNINFLWLCIFYAILLLYPMLLEGRESLACLRYRL